MIEFATDIPLLQIHNMHGPTIWYSNIWTDLPTLIKELKRLNDPRGNGGLYRLVIHIKGQDYELEPLGYEPRRF